MSEPEPTVEDLTLSALLDWLCYLDLLGNAGEKEFWVSGVPPWNVAAPLPLPGVRALIEQSLAARDPDEAILVYGALAFIPQGNERHYRLARLAHFPRRLRERYQYVFKMDEGRESPHGMVEGIDVDIPKDIWLNDASHEILHLIDPSDEPKDSHWLLWDGTDWWANFGDQFEPVTVRVVKPAQFRYGAPAASAT